MGHGPIFWEHTQQPTILRDEKTHLYRLDSAAAAAKSLQSCPTLCDRMDGSPPGSSVHGIFQGRVLEWDAIAFSKN